MTEEQRYDRVTRMDGIEIRRYHPCVMAEVTVDAPYARASYLGFRPLVSYISEHRIAMTAPVVQQQTRTDSWVVSFVMPDGMTLAQLPRPATGRIQLRAVEAETAAAIEFRGVATEHLLRRKEAALRAVLTRHGIAITGPARIARFDPPWTPGFLRRNEVVIPVADEG